MSLLSRALVSSVSLVAFVSPAFAGQVVTTPTIVVTATRSPVPITQIASSVTVITQDDIEQKNKPTVTELLREVPGVSIVANGGVGQTTRVFMRGTNSEHVLVMMDGVVINDPADPSNAFDFSNLTTDNIERIEVLRGPQSTLYGSQALGGVINIITKQGKGEPRVTGFLEYGSYNSSREGVGLSGETGRTSYSLTATNSHTNGISSFDRHYGAREKDGNDTYTFAGNIQSRLTDNFTAKFTGRYNRSQTEFDSPGSIANFGARPNDDGEPNSDSRQFNLRAAGELSLMSGKWVQELGISTVNFNRSLTTEYFPPPFFGASFGRQVFNGHRDTVDWLHHLKFVDDHLITLGAEAWTEYFSKSDLLQTNVDNRAFFADDQFTVSKDFFVNYGARLDSHQSFGRQLTWKVAPGYHIRETGTMLKTTYGTGFKAPSLSQLNDPTSGNPNLGPEHSKGWDAGFEQSLWDDKATFASTYFRNDIRGLIGFGPAPFFATLNVGRARIRGVENAIDIRPATDWTIHLNHVYTLTENRVRDVELLRRPKHQANAAVLYQYSMAGDVGVDVRYVGASRDLYFNNGNPQPIIMNNFATVNLTTNYKIDQNLTLYGRVDNLFDTHYEQVSGYGQPGLSVFGGVKVAY